MLRNLLLAGLAVLVSVSCGGGEDEPVRHEVPNLVQITRPSAGFSTSSATVTLEGTRNSGVHTVTWNNSRGGTGNATLGGCVFFPFPLPLPCWQASIPLDFGSNFITVAGEGDEGEFGSDTITITRT
jgi:hypothetical protein